MPHMPTTLHEFAGVILSVDSDPATHTEPLPVLTSARMLGADYKPCGPNLLDLLDLLCIPTGVDSAGNVTELSPFLSLVTKEILHDRAKHPTH